MAGLRLRSASGSSSLPFLAVSSTVGDGVADATSAIQAALDSANTAGGGHVYVPRGTFLLSATLTIGSNTRLELAKGATVKRNAAITAMLTNKADGTTGGYAAATNIEVVGGTWDVNAAGFASDADGLAFGHATYVTVRDVTVKNVPQWHAVEFNAVQHGRLINCTFDGWTTIEHYQDELVQIDLALGSVQFPFFGPYDSTPCDDILIQGCVFANGDRGIGTHSTAVGSPQTNVKIIGCEFINMLEEAVYLYHFAKVVVTGCTFTNCWKGVYALPVGESLADYAITDNIFTNMTTTSVQASDGRAIHVSGNNSGLYPLLRGIIQGNRVTTTALHGISVDQCSDWGVIGNSVTAAGGVGVYVWKTSRSSVIGNDAASNTTADVYIGGTSGTVATDTQDVIVANNIFGTLSVNFANRTIVAGNNASTSITVTGNATNTQKKNNYVAGTFDTTSAIGPDVQVFTSSGTWTKPSGATTVQVAAIGGGGGGGSGRRGAAATQRNGGSGGAGGGYVLVTLPASAVGATETVTVGAAGTAGAAVTVDSTNGNAGGSGGITSFGTGKARAIGGGPGVGGTNSGTQSGGTAGLGTASGGAGGGNSGSGGAGSGGATGAGGAAGAGAGGGVTTADATSAGGAGGGAGMWTGVTSGAAGAVGATPNGGAGGNANTSVAQPGGAGGGGASSITQAGGDGGAGGLYGGGGGGGGASLNGNNSGAGGVGAGGICIVTSW